MGGEYGDNLVSGPGAIARFRVKCSVRTKEIISFRLELGSGSNVTARVRMHFRIKVMHG